MKSKKPKRLIRKDLSKMDKLTLHKLQVVKANLNLNPDSSPVVKVVPGETYRFIYTYYGTPDSLPSYTAHSGQLVIVERQLTKKECLPECQPSFWVKAHDGWRGNVHGSELYLAGRLPEWRVHIPNLLKEILDNQACAAFKMPLQIFSNLLHKAGMRAVEINDPELNWLMCRLTVYAQADPQDKEHNPLMLLSTWQKAENSLLPLSEMLRSYILRALKLSGSWDPSKCLLHVEEQMALSDFELANGFLTWCYKNKRVFGSANIGRVWFEWQKTRITPDAKISE